MKSSTIIWLALFYFFKQRIPPIQHKPETGSNAERQRIPPRPETVNNCNVLLSPPPPPPPPSAATHLAHPAHFFLPPQKWNSSAIALKSNHRQSISPITFASITGADLEDDKSNNRIRIHPRIAASPARDGSLSPSPVGGARCIRQGGVRNRWRH